MIHKPSRRLAFLVEYLDLPAATDDPEAEWEEYQIRHLNNSSLFGITTKSRQVGWSWTVAAEAVADSVLYPRTPNMFVSINLEESREKIRYARQIIDALDAEVRPVMIIDNQLELELHNGSRMISHPSKPVRGKARVNLKLDELAHYPKDREIYTSAVPVTSRGGRLRAGSSPMGAGGIFYDIVTQSLERYPGYTRDYVPWWVIKAFCKDVPEAKKLAPHMTTEERVMLFGKPRLITIFQNLPLLDFQQEYECMFVDETTAWITWDEIKRNQMLAQAGQLVHYQARDVDEAMQAIDDLAAAVAAGQVENVMVGGMDVGRSHNLTEIILLGVTNTNQLPYRLGISLDRVEFDDQKAVVTKIMEKLPVLRFFIDRNGLGMEMAEAMEKQFPIRAEGMNFTQPSKELWSVALKVRMQRKEVPLPVDRDLSYQIHSIRKRITGSKKATYDTQANERHHADKYWALALAVWAVAAPPPDEEEIEVHEDPVNISPY